MSKVNRGKVWAVMFVLIVGFLFSESAFANHYTVYECDVKNFTLSTTINIYKNNESFAKVKGNIVTILTDPLTMYNLNGDKIAYAGDVYHFVAQDSHSIYVGGKFACEMVGLVDLWGESYKIYDNHQNQIASVKFNYADTSGKMYDNEGELIAKYASNVFFNDFEVRISNKCKLDERTVLMIFCSYYSDKDADSRKS